MSKLTMNKNYKISKNFYFEAAHKINYQLKDYDSDVLHGHSFFVEIEFSGQKLCKEGWVMEFGELNIIIKKLKSFLDHKYLNEIEGLEVPTLENIASWIADKIDNEALTKVVIERKSLGEKCTLSINYAC